MEDSQSNRYDLLQSSDAPPVEDLAGLFEDLSSKLDANYQYSEQCHRERFCDWPGRSRDGKKHGTQSAPAFPWEGASDLRTWNIDDITNKLCALASHSLDNAKVSAFCASGADPAAAGESEQFMDWYLKRALPSARRNFKLAAQWGVSFGFAAMGVYWEEKRAKIKSSVPAAELAEASGHIALWLDDESAEEPSPEAVSDAGEILGCSAAEAKKRLLACKAFGAADRDETATVYSRARLRALRVGRDIFFPREVESIQDAPCVFTVEFLSPNQLRERAESERWKPEFLDEVLKKFPGSRGGEKARSSASASMADKDVGENRVKIVRAYYEAHDSSGAQSKRYCVFCPAVLGDSKTLYAASARMESQRYPFEVYAFEHAESEILDARGTAEIAEGWQREIKTQKDLRVDNASISINPPKLFRVGNKPDSAFGPNAWIPVRSGDFKIIEPLKVAADPSVSIEIEKSVRDDMFSYFGNPGAPEPTSLENIQQQAFISDWLEFCSKIAGIVFEYVKIYRADPYRFEPLGSPRGTVAEFAPASAPAAEFSLAFDARDLALKDFLEKYEVFAKFALPLDRTGDINTGPLLRKLIARLFPNDAPQIISSPQDSERREILETQGDLAAIFSLQPVNAPERCNARLRLEIVSNYAATPAIAARMEVDSAFSQALQTYTKQLQHQLDQEQNAVIGRLGAAPAPGLPQDSEAANG